MNHALAEDKSSGYGLDGDCYYHLAKLGLTADRAGLMITSLETLPNGEDGAELLLMGEGLAFAFAVIVKPWELMLFLVPCDGNAASNRFRILGTANTPANWERMTSAVLRIGTWKPKEDWQKALAKPVELEDLIVVCA